MVVTVKFALVAPAGTVMLAGTVVAAELSDSETAAPPAGAAALNVTVPVEGLPPTTVDGFVDSDDNVAGAGGGGGDVAVSAVIFMTKASPQKIDGSPPKTTSNAPAVTGKSLEIVCPVT